MASRTKSRKIPTRNTLPLFSVLQGPLQRNDGAPFSLLLRLSLQPVRIRTIRCWVLRWPCTVASGLGFTCLHTERTSRQHDRSTTVVKEHGVILDQSSNKRTWPALTWPGCCMGLTICCWFATWVLHAAYDLLLARHRRYPFITTPVLTVQNAYDHNSTPMGANPISSGPPHVRPMGRTRGEPDEIKKNTHPKNITALSGDQVENEYDHNQLFTQMRVPAARPFTPQVHAASRSIPPPWGSIRLRPPAHLRARPTERTC